ERPIDGRAAFGVREAEEILAGGVDPERLIELDFARRPLSYVAGGDGFDPLGNDRVLKLRDVLKQQRDADRGDEGVEPGRFADRFVGEAFNAEADDAADTHRDEQD